MGRTHLVSYQKYYNGQVKQHDYTRASKKHIGALITDRLSVIDSCQKQKTPHKTSQKSVHGRHNLLPHNPLKREYADRKPAPSPPHLKPFPFHRTPQNNQALFDLTRVTPSETEFTE